MRVPRVGKMKTIHKIKKRAYCFLSRTDFILYSLEENPLGICCSVFLYEESG